MIPTFKYRFATKRTRKTVSNAKVYKQTRPKKISWKTWSEGLTGMMISFQIIFNLFLLMTCDIRHADVLTHFKWKFIRSLADFQYWFNVCRRLNEKRKEKTPPCHKYPSSFDIIYVLTFVFLSSEATSQHLICADAHLVYALK